MESREKCFECERPAIYDHHVVPKSLGGSATLPLCEFCHSKVHENNNAFVDQQFIIEQKRKMGIAFGNTPFGYAIENGKKVNNESEQETISIITSLYNLNHFCKEIAEILNGRRYETRNHKKWGGGAIVNILRREGLYDESRPVVRKPLYGYCLLLGEKVCDEEEQKVIEKIISLKKKGLTDVKICRYLNDQGYEKRGKKWSATTVRSLLKQYDTNRNGPRGGSSPYGYAHGFSGMAPIESEQEIIKMIDSLSALCMPYWKIARKLNELGYRTRRKNKWSTSSVCSIIRGKEETKMKRVSITIDKRLWKEFHVKADMENVPVRDLIERLVRKYVDSDKSPDIPLEVRRKLGLGRQTLKLH